MSGLQLTPQDVNAAYTLINFSCGSGAPVYVEASAGAMNQYVGSVVRRQPVYVPAVRPRPRSAPYNPNSVTVIVRPDSHSRPKSTVPNGVPDSWNMPSTSKAQTSTESMYLHKKYNKYRELVNKTNEPGKKPMENGINKSEQGKKRPMENGNVNMKNGPGKKQRMENATVNAKNEPVTKSSPRSCNRQGKKKSMETGTVNKKHEAVYMSMEGRNMENVTQKKTIDMGVQTDDIPQQLSPLSATGSIQDQIKFKNDASPRSPVVVLSEFCKNCKQPMLSNSEDELNEAPAPVPVANDVVEEYNSDDDTDYVPEETESSDEDIEVDEVPAAAVERREVEQQQEQEEEEEDRAMPGTNLVPIGDGKARVPARLLRKINWSSHTVATRALLGAVFQRSVLATHSLSGKPSPAFPNKPAKSQLDPELVNDIIKTVVKRSKVRASIVRTCITTKCADECKMLRIRHKNRASGNLRAQRNGRPRRQ